MINGEYKIDRPKRSLKTIVTLIILLILALGAVGMVYFFTKINRGASEVSTPTEITIESGASTRQIANMLTDQKVIRGPRLFMGYAILTNASGKIQAGQYTLDRKMSIVEIIDVLTAGKVTRNEKKITIIEGWSNNQIGNYLNQRGIATTEEFNAALDAKYDFEFTELALATGYEGFLFPDTYEISKDSGPEALVAAALENFETKLSKDLRDTIAKKNLELKTVMIIASIVEKEVGRNTVDSLTEQDLNDMQRERELVASVFYNRLDIGMALQSDATVNYVTGRSDRQARGEDLGVDSPYNTYKFAGLPPGPIGNPGLGSIRAAISPAQSDYFYFLNKTDGVAVFSKTFEEHNRAKAEFLD